MIQDLNKIIGYHLRLCLDGNKKLLPFVKVLHFGIDVLNEWTEINCLLYIPYCDHF